MSTYIQIILIINFSLILRWCITYHAHSGQEKPPMYGDYEAQRHWQEITLNLPIETWYINTTDNNLQYWGLDYPPLTAYHSLLLGYVANRTNQSFVKLYESRGISSPEHKYFMRMTVLLADLMIFMPAMIWYITKVQTTDSFQMEDNNLFGFKRKHFILLSALLYPGIILIDHGHFQYNCISLGFFVFAATAILSDSFIIGSFWFVLALNYKQMELYHALPIFFYILGKCQINETKSLFSSVYKLLCISLTVIITFVIIWLPFLRDLNTFYHVILRLFPLNRGIFEDKVANAWCALNVLYKLRDTFTNEQLARICLIITTISILPTCVTLYLSPKKESFIISLINSALAFFLFSFQVHEKSILLVAVPVLLHFHNDPFICFWFLLISHFSMLPLYIKDNLYLAYVATAIFYFVSIIWLWPELLDNKKEFDKCKIRLTKGKSKEKLKLNYNIIEYFSYFSSYLKYRSNYNFLKKALFCISLVGALILSFSTRFLEPPEKYPDLFALLVSVYSCLHFFIFFLYFNYKLLARVHNNFTVISKVH